MKKSIFLVLLFSILLPIAQCFAADEYFGTYDLFVMWNKMQNSYVSGADLQRMPNMIPTLRLAADGLYMPADKLVCAKPQYKTQPTSPDTLNNPIIKPVITEGIKTVTRIIVTAENCGMQLMLVNDKFMLVFGHDEPPLVYYRATTN